MQAKRSSSVSFKAVGSEQSEACKACGSEQAKALKTKKQRTVERARKVKTTNAI